MPRHKFEFAAAVLIIAVLAVVLLQRLSDMRREMEEAMVQSEVSALRVELLDRLAHREAFGGALPEGSNPVVWASRAPAEYAGELDEAPQKRGIWYYDRRAGHLVYRFRAGDEWRFRLARGGRIEASGVLGGVGLLRVDRAASVN